MSIYRCCGPTMAPLSMVHRPGLDELAVRIGTHRTFLADMKARLSSQDLPALAALTTHDTADPVTALLDAWAAVGDVLTFYQERIANEGYLRTATERRSLVEQAALVGYHPRPGVAASTYLSYTVDDNAGPVEIPTGTRVTSVPGPGEKMQTFETSEPLVARHEWNRLGVRTAQPQTAADVVVNGLVLAGTATGLSVGDALLVDLGIGLELSPARVRAVEPQPEADRTRVTLESWTGEEMGIQVLLATVHRLADSAAFDIDPDGATAKKVLAALATVEKQAREGNQSSENALLVALEVSRQQLDIARRNNWPKIATWLREGVLRLRSVLPEGMDTMTARFGERRQGRRLDELLDNLAAPPSIQPRGSRQLTRTAEATLTRGADAYPALLATLRPELSQTLYGALARLDAAPVSPLRVWAMRLAAPLFGHNAPLEAKFSSKGVFTGFKEWDLTGEKPAIAFLDREHPGVLTDTPVLITRPMSNGFGPTVVTEVDKVEPLSRNVYGLAGKSTKLTFKKTWWLPDPDDVNDADRDEFNVLRAALVHCGAEELELADAPIEAPLCGGELELDGLYDGLRSGRWMIVAGERADLPGTSGVQAAEVVMLDGVSQRVKTVPSTGYLTNATPASGGNDPDSSEEEVPLPGDALHTFVSLAAPLAYCYRLDTVVLYGNVVHATHGETHQEVLGGGDPTKRRQEFHLRQPPLTWTSAPTNSGVASTLEVRVDDVSWRESPSVVGLGPTTRAFLTRQDESGATTVVFGDGVHGARPHTGTDNIRATYRNGLGRAGNLAAGQLSQLGSRPLGVKEVVNLVSATGGTDAESRDQIRHNAPLAVLALDRLVGTQDYADFARTFAGIGKAASVRITDGRRQLVHVTIAGVEDIPVDESSDLFRNLTEALHRFGDRALPLRVQIRRLLALVVSARVKVLPDYHWDSVEPMVRSAVLEALGFDRRGLGQNVLPSEVVACIQAVRGVDYVDLDVLTALNAEDVVRRLSASVDRTAVLPGSPGAQPPWPPRPGPVLVQPARLVDDVVQAAELAYLQPGVPDSLILNQIPDEVTR
ncbi:putative baseplate assembly protein [Arthrobacter sp. AK04]|uniref:putative baseplate assembly protein n=1 Tax=Arthrobacter sp. AK04 TaxID=2900048 RepID=UPI001E33FC4A|nr:putative baseplate assembly protein [Arthrobacter sp. AK04]MCD5341570.1 putative baseplate assembly protein [Arthrobacter sp. AK04]